MAIRKRTEYIVVHVTATTPAMDIGATEVDRMHRNRGFNGIGYHYVIRRSGVVETGRAENQVGAHVRGFNSVSLGVSMVGGVDSSGRPENNMTPEQFKALEALLRKLTKKYPEAKICGHRDLSPDRDGDGVVEPNEYLKACPCFDAIPWAQSKGLPAANIKGTWDAASKPPIVVPDARTVYLQKLLQRAGYEFGPVDGVVGPKTRAALKRFQMAAGLEKTGEFDQPTVDRLRQRFEQTTEKVEVEIDRPVVPEEIDQEVERKTGWWRNITGVFGGGAVGGGFLWGADWQVVAIIGGGAVVLLLLVILLRRQIAAAIKDVRAAVEGGT